MRAAPSSPFFHPASYIYRNRDLRRPPFCSTICSTRRCSRRVEQRVRRLAQRERGRRGAPRRALISPCGNLQCRKSQRSQKGPQTACAASADQPTDRPRRPVECRGVAAMEQSVIGAFFAQARAIRRTATCRQKSFFLHGERVRLIGREPAVGDGSESASAYGQHRIMNVRRHEGLFCGDEIDEVNSSTADCFLDEFGTPRRLRTAECEFVSAPRVGARCVHKTLASLPHLIAAHAARRRRAIARHCGFAPLSFPLRLCAFVSLAFLLLYTLATAFLLF